MEPVRTGREYNDERDMEAFWAAAAPEREPIKQRWYIPGLLVCIVLSIPWYYEPHHLGRVVLGLPVWVWVSLGCSIACGALTALAALRFWSDGEGKRG